jgi:hypothetical protein
MTRGIIVSLGHCAPSGEQVYHYCGKRAEGIVAGMVNGL